MDPRYQGIYDSLGGVYDPQTQAIQKQQAELPAQFDAQRSGLEQAKVNAFKGISNTANSRGVYFSGFRPNEEATYTGSTYLPAVAKVAAAQTQATSQLQQALNDVNAKRSLQAQSQLQAILEREQAQRQWEAEQAQKVSLSNSRSSGRGGSTKIDYSPYIASAASELQKLIGKDKYVSPNTMKALRSQWVGAGLDAKIFNQNFRGFAPPGKRAANYGF